MKHRLALFAAALWWGSLTVVGFLVVPLLFAHLATPAMAGSMAGRLFQAEVWIALGCGLFLIVYLRSVDDERMSQRSQTLLAIVAVAMLLALLQEFAVAPRILARDNLRLWHSLGTAIYLAHWLCASAILWRLAPPRAQV